MLRSYTPKSANRFVLTLMTAIFLSGAVAWLNTGVDARVNGRDDDCDSQMPKGPDGGPCGHIPISPGASGAADGSI
jgi:hypothetical protein